MKLRALSLLIVALLVGGCSSVRLSDTQRAVVQTRIFPGASVENVFNHLKYALSQNHYAIKSGDLSDGVLVASRNLPDQGGARERREEIVMNIDKTPQGVRVRLSIQLIVHYSLGGSYGVEKLDRGSYDQLFVQMDKSRDESRVPASIKLK
ncbi:MAG: hypothetical protein HYR96_09985 [Deltaproteobacteria bacterium]|nr:hypothetical protein [Deltaproteobacteria bacterium]MBI3296059.1 hypothetical protein [Deltaproteobacteria bacterium]